MNELKNKQWWLEVYSENHLKTEVACRLTNVKESILKEWVASDDKEYFLGGKTVLLTFKDAIETVDKSLIKGMNKQYFMDWIDSDAKCEYIEGKPECTFIEAMRIKGFKV